MANRYYNKINKTEALEGLHSIDPPDVVSLDESNPFFSILPEGQRLTYDIDGVPDGLEAIPPIILTAEEQAKIDLFDAGVTNNAITSANYLNNRGDSSAINAINASVDIIVISSGLTLSQVSVLIQ